MKKQVKKVEDLKIAKKTILMLSTKMLNIEPDFNIRQDMGDLNALAKDIEQNGIRNPVRGFKRDGLYYITDGARRLGAAIILEEKYGIRILVPSIIETLGVSEEQRVVDMFVCNSGKRLNPVEESEGVMRLINYGFKESEIAVRIGYTKVYVSNLKLLNSAPKKLKDLIIQNIVSATLAMQVLRNEKDFDSAMQTIEDAIKQKSQLTKEKTKKTTQTKLDVEPEENKETDETEEKVKITAKDIDKSKGVKNSFSALDKAIKQADEEKMPVKNNKLGLLNYLRGIIDGKYSKEDFLLDLFEVK